MLRNEMKNMFLLIVNKRSLLGLATFLLPLVIFAQSQYDYYDDDAVAGGADRALNGIIIIILLVLAFLAFAFVVGGIMKIYYWFNPEADPEYKRKEEQGNKSTDKNNKGKKPYCTYSNSHNISFSDINIQEWSREVSDEEIANGFIDSSGVVYTSDFTQLLKCKNEHIKEYHIKAECIAIRSNAFYRCYELSKIIFPKGLGYIGEDAFYGCNISSLVFPHDLKLIGDRAFSGCSKLSYITLPESIVKIGESSFFRTGIRNVVCKSPYYSYENGCLIELKNKTLIAFFSDSNEAVIPDGVITIGKRSFSECRNLNRIMFPKSLKKIDDEAFCMCSNLQSLYIPESVTHIGDDAFSWCSLKDIVLPANISYLGNGVFEYCEHLSSIVLPDNLIYIGDNAFKRCKMLSNIVLPSSLNHLGKSAFAFCENLLSVTIPKTLANIAPETFYRCENISNIILPTELKKIGDSAFEGCVKLESVSLPLGLLEIGECTFCMCSNLQDIVLPETCISIGKHAFSFCANLKKISLPSNMKSIGKGAFAGTHIREAVSNSANFKIENKFLIDVINKSLITFFSDDNANSVMVPQEVVHIGHDAFAECGNLTNVVLPEGVTDIEETAFGWCRNLEKITMPHSLKHIEKDAFVCCGLSEVTLPKQTVVEEGAFMENCKIIRQ